jgi:hypothetical protein
MTAVLPSCSRTIPPTGGFVAVAAVRLRPKLRRGGLAALRAGQPASSAALPGVHARLGAVGSIVSAPCPSVSRRWCLS